jgi:hypothetical protein
MEGATAGIPRPLKHIWMTPTLEKKFIPAVYVTGMDRFAEYGLRGDQDELVRRAFRDAFQRAGLSRAQLGQAMEWYKERGQHLGGDVAKLTESFGEFAVEKGWASQHLEAAVSVYGQISEQGPAAMLAPAPSPEEDAATVARADELLRTNPDAYWRDVELQESVLEARERQEAAPAAAPAVDDYAIERRIGQQDVDKFARMMREEPGKYWGSPELQRQHHDAIAASIQEAPANPPPAPAPAVAPAMQPIPVAASPPLVPDAVKP